VAVLEKFKVNVFSQKSFNWIIEMVLVFVFFVLFESKIFKFIWSSKEANNRCSFLSDKQ